MLIDELKCLYVKDSKTRNRFLPSCSFPKRGHFEITALRSRKSFFLLALKSVFFCFAMAFSALVGSVQAQTPTCSTAQATLIAFYNATGGASWTTPWNTNTGLTPDLGIANTDWKGVETDSSCRVVKLKLDGNNLSGTIPTELGNLTSLTELGFYNNELSGEIPTELGNLTSLTELDLALNNLSGEIPAELGNLTALTELILTGNELSGEIPAELGNLTSLTELYLHNNELSGEIPTELGSLTSLQYLYLHENELSGEILTELGNLTSLQRLYLYLNELSGTIPAELGNLTSLQRLQLNTNELSGEIPTELGNLTSLQRLQLNNNELSGEIPTELGNLTSLQYLYLYVNELSGTIPAELGNLTSLLYLYLYVNELSGTIPAELGNLTSLQRLYLYYNELSGEIPTELGSLVSRLTQLVLHENQLSGTIPTELGALTNLQYLYLGTNELSGEIPTELEALTSLQRLYLHENQLSGEIPTELEALTNLQYLYLGTNELSGEIPTELEALTSLRRLYLYENQLSGEIPTELEALTSLQSLYLDTNELSGEIPTELGNLTSLQSLYLHENELSGTIPTELGALTSLQRLYLHENQLSGEIPADLASPTNLQQLYLHNNMLTGSIPTDLESIPASRILHEVSLWGNELTFTENSELGKRIDRAALRVFYDATGGNDWTSEQEEENNWLPIQGDFDSATFTVQDLLSFSDWDGVSVNGEGRVSELNLSDNNLEGEIGNELEAPSGLVTLNLSSNASLGGTLPVGMPGLTNLETLNIKCTEIETPTDTAFDTWLASIDFTDSPCVEPPVFNDGTSTTRDFNETIGDAAVGTASNIGTPVAATDTDVNDTLTYSLEGTDAAKFGIIMTSGQIQTKPGEKYDYEAKPSYSVMVKVEDSYGGFDTIDVTLNITDQNEAPLRPAAPSVSATTGSTTSLDVMWTAPSNTGRPAIMSYDLRYKKTTETDWTNGPQNQSGTRASIGSLEEGTAYRVQVLATNDEGDSSWSPSRTGSTNERNNVPTFDEGADTERDLAETIGNATVGTAGNIGSPVTATDDDNDTLTYSLEGTDKDKFRIVTTNGQIQTKVRKSYDYEVKQSYSVIVKVEDGNGESATIDVTINITDQDEAPLRPAAPSVTSTSGSTTSLDVMWTAPSNTGRPAIMSYDLRYKKTTEMGWTNGPQNQSGTSVSIGSLEEGTAYGVQVLATNDEGDSSWSPSGTGSTNMPPPPPPPPSPPPPVTGSELGPEQTIQISAMQEEGGGSGCAIGSDAEARNISQRAVFNLLLIISSLFAASWRSSSREQWILYAHLGINGGSKSPRLRTRPNTAMSEIN